MSNFLKFFTFFATLAIFVNSSLLKQESSINDKFKNWINQYQIESNNEYHLSHIYFNWLANDKFIFESNARNLSYTLDHNAYSGMNSSEFSEFMGFRANQEYIAKGSYKNLRSFVPVISQDNIYDMDTLATSIDWRTKGVVGAIRNQKQCGSCWAFSGTSTLESAVAIKTGHLYDLSEQQSVSCAGLRYGNLGCNGGFYDGLWNYAKDNGGICSESSYPYTSGNGNTGNCIKECSPISETKVQSYVSVTPKSDSALLTALNVGTISIAIEADTKSFQLFKSGIYNDYEGCNSNSQTKGANSQPNIDHAVVLVGYGSQNGQDYYILRNSWDTTWGENGYMKIERGDKYAPWGMCGLLYQPDYPVV